MRGGVGVGGVRGDVAVRGPHVRCGLVGVVRDDDRDVVARDGELLGFAAVHVL